jgi:hypothetical protein
MPSPFIRHGLVGGVPSGATRLHFCKKGVKLMSECIKRTCYKEVSNSWTWPTLVARNGSPSRTHSCPKTWRLRSGCGGTFQPLSAPRFGPWGVQTSTPGTINCGLFWRTWLAKSVTTTWIPRESSGRNPPRDGACRDSRLVGASQCLRRGIGRPFWVALLQIKT